MNLKVIGIIAILLISVMALGCAEMPPSASTSIENPKSMVVSATPQPVKTSTIITASPSQMLPTINDMPDGSIKISETANETYAKRDFALTGFVTQSLKYEANKFYSDKETINNYNNIKNTYSNYKLSNVNLGDEGFGYEIANSLSIVVFRKANAVIKVELVGQYSAKLSDAISYAAMVKTPTSSIILTESKTTPLPKAASTVNKEPLRKDDILDIGNGYTLKVRGIDLVAKPQVWIEFSRNGIVFESYVFNEGQTHTFNNYFTIKTVSISTEGVLLEIN